MSFKTVAPRLKERMLPFFGMSLLGVMLAALSVSIPAIQIIGLLVVVLLALVIFALPELGLVITSLGGRFNRVPFLETIDGPVYVAALSLSLTVFVMIMRRRFHALLSRAYLFACLLFLAVLAAGVMYSVSPSYGTTKLIEFAFYTLPLLVLALSMVTSRQHYVNFFLGLAVITFGLALLGIAGGVLSGGLANGRISALGGGPNVFGRFMVIGALSTLFLINCIKVRGFAVCGYIAFAIYAIAAFYSGSRQAFIGFILALVMYGLLIWLKSSNKKRSRFLLTLGIVGALLVSIFTVIPVEKITGGTAWIRLTLLFQEDKGTSVDARFVFAEAAWYLFQQRWFTGWGTGSFARMYSEEIRYPHNIFLEVMCELGAIGLAAFLIVLAVAAFATVRLMISKKKSELSGMDVSLIATVITCFFFSLYAAQISGDLYDNRWVWLFGALLAGLPHALK
ncbi:O-antigen ligase family protein [Aneurinibacillus thermoaerophilus]|uniref:O-antigen ligase family protein n=1 Tax=Aneurinibacillus TaxID=55079 RepID=UPI000709125C|nr:MULTISPECIES: O-antigen ligase family protein [Aneurinibacillus]AMA71684.1 hypothetical protein ACH33_01740 [Aneurinibacillus sp. XH2]MED0757671.1 O-antigen ligase family protein [Aneurinibacillus thermoaerophilus]MED0759310.1 O-antigen ligase family protein [Aneurinibacillus thermoaerophilus]